MRKSTELKNLRFKHIFASALLMGFLASAMPSDVLAQDTAQTNIQTKQTKQDCCAHHRSHKKGNHQHCKMEQGTCPHHQKKDCCKRAKSNKPCPIKKQSDHATTKPAQGQ